MKSLFSSPRLVDLTPIRHAMERKYRSRGPTPDVQMAVSLRALVVGALAIGALAVGAFAIGSLVIGRMAVGKARIKNLEIDQLTVRNLRILKDEANT